MDMKIATITQHDIHTGEIDGESFDIYWEDGQLIARFKEVEKEETLECIARSFTEAVDITWELYSRGQGYRCHLLID